MNTALAVLAVLALIFVVLTIARVLPLWVPVLILCLYALLQQLPTLRSLG